MYTKHAVYAYPGRVHCLHVRSLIITGEDMVAKYQFQLSFHQLAYKSKLLYMPQRLLF